MYEFTAAQQKKALFWLVLFHIFIIAASNYLVQFPFKFSVSLPLGRIFLPLYLPRHRPDRAHFRCAVGETDYFWVMFPALLLSYVFSVLFHDGNWTGWASLAEFTFVGRIALASFFRLCAWANPRYFRVQQITPSEIMVGCPHCFHRCRQRFGHAGVFSPLPFMPATMNLWRQTGGASHLSIICSNSPSAPSSSCLPTASY